MLNKRQKSIAILTQPRYLGLVIKLLVTIGLIWALYRQLFVAHDFDILASTFVKTIHDAPLHYLVLLIVFVPINLFLEAWKFNLLVNSSAQLDETIQVRKLSIRESFRRILAGLSIGIFTPNRVGEYAGRLTNAKPGERKTVIAATFLGGIAQWIPLLYGGLMGLFLLGVPEVKELQAEELKIFLVALLGLGFLVVYFQFEKILKLVGGFLERVNYSSKSSRGWFSRKRDSLLSKISSLTNLQVSSVSTRVTVLLIASLRYCIYLLQLVLALKFVGLDVSWGSLFAGSAALFLAQTFLPLPAVVQALARTELALLLWASFSPNPLSIAVGSMLIFVLNLGLPALIGLFIILRSNVNQTLGVEPV